MQPLHNQALHTQLIHTQRNLRSCVFLHLGLASVIPPIGLAELVTFENTNPSLETLRYYQAADGIGVLGQSLNVTRGAFDQPELGALPVGSIMIAWFGERSPRDGDWIYMGSGLNTTLARADELVEVIDPFTLNPVGYIGAGDFDDGQAIGKHTNWTDGWVGMHARVDTAPDEGVYFTDESFTIGIRFTMSDGVHYGFAEMTRTAFEAGNPLSIKYRPVRWGYETTPGVAVPGVGSSMVLGMCFAGMCGVRRRR